MAAPRRFISTRDGVSLRRRRDGGTGTPSSRRIHLHAVARNGDAATHASAVAAHQGPAKAASTLRNGAPAEAHAANASNKPWRTRASSSLKPSNSTTRASLNQCATALTSFASTSETRATSASKPLSLVEASFLPHCLQALSNSRSAPAKPLRVTTAALSGDGASNAAKPTKLIPSSL